MGKGHGKFGCLTLSRDWERVGKGQSEREFRERVGKGQNYFDNKFGKGSGKVHNLRSIFVSIAGKGGKGSIERDYPRSASP